MKSTYHRIERKADESEINVLIPGSYFFTEFRVCDEYLSDTVVVENIVVNAPQVVNDTVEQFSPALLKSNDPMTIWTADTTDQEIFFEGDEFHISALADDSVVFAALSETIEFDPEFIGPLQPDTLLDGYHNTALNGGMFFNTLEDCLLEQVTVFCRRTGPRTITIVDEQASQEIYRKQLMCDIGFNTLDIGAFLDGGKNYVISTDPNQNLNNFGFRSPDFMRSSTDVDFPFNGSLLQITESTFGTGQYYYFYNWRVKPEDKVCNSYWKPVYAVVDENSAIESITGSLNEFNIYPNPTPGHFNIYIKNSSEWNTLKIYDINGMLLRQSKVDSDFISNNIVLATGLYMVELNDQKGNSIIRKLMVY